MTARNATSPRDRTQTEQSVGTPDDFFSVVNAEFRFCADLAADWGNTKCQIFLSEEDDSLSRAWRDFDGWLWLNPPFSNIRPWAQMCFEESQQGAKVCMLVPASVGAGWFRDWVWGQCEIRFLNTRLKFIGHPTPFPKDCMLCVYEAGRFPSVGPWDWKAKLAGRPFFALPSRTKRSSSPKLETKANLSAVNENPNPIEAA